MLLYSKSRCHVHLGQSDSRNLKQAKEHKGGGVGWGDPQPCHCRWLAAWGRLGKRLNFPEWNTSYAMDLVSNSKTGGSGGTNNSLRRPDGEGTWGRTAESQAAKRELQNGSGSRAGCHRHHIVFSHRQVVELWQRFERNFPVSNGPMMGELTCININVV